MNPMYPFVRLVALATCGFWVPPAGTLWGAGGVLRVEVQDEQTGDPAITRVEISRADAPQKVLPIRRSIPTGIGVVLDRQAEWSLPDGGYQFRMIRGPEYRIVSGTFALEDTSSDRHSVQLPRMIDMRGKGWTSGDCCVVASPHSLPLRMASEDLHLAAVLGHLDAKPIPGRDRDDPLEHEPCWIREDAECFDGLIFYGRNPDQWKWTGLLPSERLAEATVHDETRVAIENPFAWAMPVWLSSGRIDGVFLLGDWLRLDRPVRSVPEGRRPTGGFADDPKSVGRWAERIYWQMLEAGFRIPPLAGGGDESARHPVGYNRLYVADPLQEYQRDGSSRARPVETPERWWHAAWLGQSVATNGPLLRPRLGGELPGHVFRATRGEVLQLQPELNLTVRDPVEYLEVIHNGRVHHSARLDEFARAGGRIPPIEVDQSGWVTVRVVTLYEDHFRAAMSAPWYIEFDQSPRITTESVDFFRTWLAEYEGRLRRLPADELRRHVPFVRAARAFWADRADRAEAATD